IGIDEGSSRPEALHCAASDLNPTAAELRALDFSTFVASFRRYVLRLVALSAAAGLIVYFASWALPRSYTAETRLYVGSLTTSTYDEQLAYENLAQTYAQLALTTPVIERVRLALSLKDTPEQLVARLDVRAPTGLSFVR